MLLTFGKMGKCVYTVEPLIKDTPNRFQREDNLHVKDKMPGPNVPNIQRFRPMYLVGGA